MQLVHFAFSMKAKYVSLLQLKGGAGKSTIACNLCGYFLSKNKTVTAIDADMQQGTMYAWSQIYKHPKFSCHGVHTLDELISLLEKIDGTADIVVIDLPPRLADIARSSLMFSDLVLLPVSISTPDIWAASDITPLIQRAKQDKPNINLRVVWNRYKATKRKAEYKAETQAILGHKTITQTISDYVAYSDVIGCGTWVGDFNHAKAKAEFISFGDEVAKIIK